MGERDELRRVEAKMAGSLVHGRRILRDVFQIDGDVFAYLVVIHICLRKRREKRARNAMSPRGATPTQPSISRSHTSQFLSLPVGLASLAPPLSRSRRQLLSYFSTLSACHPAERHQHRRVRFALPPNELRTTAAPYPPASTPSPRCADPRSPGPGCHPLRSTASRWRSLRSAQM